jgi:hypothetical protein
VPALDSRLFIDYRIFQNHAPADLTLSLRSQTYRKRDLILEPWYPTLPRNHCLAECIARDTVRYSAGVFFPADSEALHLHHA